MGQINSSQCTYHCLRTRHSEEGYCTLCNERFSNLRGRDIPDERSGKLCPCYDCTSKENTRVDISNNSQQARFHSIEADIIFKCEHCPRFFYSINQLAEHTGASQLGHTWNARFSATAEPTPDNIHKHRRIGRILDCLDASLLHVQRPEITRKDLETERQHICCVRCGIYFSSKEQKRKHFRDVEDYIMRVEAFGDSTQYDSNSAHGDGDDLVDLETPSANLFPLPPSTVISNVTRTPFIPPSKPTSAGPNPHEMFPAVVSHSSPYVPELRAGFREMRALPPLAARYGKTFTFPTSDASSSSAMVDTIRISNDFECSLCLENEKDISSLPCGHIFGTTCIYKTLDSDPRCPLCRRPAERRSMKRLRST